MSTTETGLRPVPPPPQLRRRRRPTTLARVKTGLGDVILKLEAGELEPKRANALVYAYSTLGGVIQGTDLEQRIATLERTANHDRR